MTKFFVLGIYSLLLATPALADHYRYEVTVEGMFCAYCAYNVSKRFGALEGVGVDAVDVDLPQRQVVFTSTRAVPDALITASLEDSGFRVTEIHQRHLKGPSPAASSLQALATVALDADAAGSALATDLLDRLGTAAFEGGGRFTVNAPAALETAVLRPLIAGRRKAIKVAFDDNSDGQVVVTLLAPKADAQ